MRTSVAWKSGVLCSRSEAESASPWDDIEGNKNTKKERKTKRKEKCIGNGSRRFGIVHVGILRAFPNSREETKELMELNQSDIPEKTQYTIISWV